MLGALLRCLDSLDMTMKPVLIEEEEISGGFAAANLLPSCFTPLCPVMSNEVRHLMMNHRLFFSKE
jgi:hypothetical protein